MAKILTPVSLWKDFNSDLEVMPVTLGEKIENGVRFEYVNFSGRDTGMGRVTIFGVLATAENSPSDECVLLMQDVGEDFDYDLLSYFVKNGYTALFVDYCGKGGGAERYTLYPENVNYANAAECGRSKDYVDESADRTCWYEWVAVGAYARKYLSEKFSTDSIGLVGIRDGAEIAWKLAYVAQFSCMVAINGCGWKAYRGIGKYEGEEPEFDDERYRFVAGIDSQGYAPYVKCPVLVLCATGDSSFNYDRAYDTFSRINPEFSPMSSIAYSLNSGARLNTNASKDMFMFLDSNVKGRHVFMPKPAELSIYVDDEENLVARVSCDSMGIVEKCGAYLAEDSLDYSTRDWVLAPLKKVISATQSEYYLNVYEKSTTLFVLCYAVYSSGFTVWSKIAVKKISGKFRNSRAKSKIMFNNSFGPECFSVAEGTADAMGGVFLADDELMPQLVTEDGLCGVYCKCGLVTNRLKSPQFAPEKDSILKFDVYSEEDMELKVSLKCKDSGDIYFVQLYILGGVWHSQILEAKVLKNANGISLDDYTQCESLTVVGSAKFALNNIIWL